MKKFATICFCLVILCAGSKTQAQPIPFTNQDWEALRSVVLGTKLRVEQKDGKRVVDKLATVSDTELTLVHKGKPQVVPRAEVKRVWRVDPPDGTKRAIFTGIGAGAGLMGGLALGVALGFKDCGGSCVDEGAGIIAAVVGLPVGGALAGRALAGHRYTLLYVAP